VNPRDGALFIATHTGLFRAAPGDQKSRRVADRYQDTMGFTVVGPDEFLGSGHPDGREGLPPFLGLIRSRDAGESWNPVSLLGKVDFHVLEARGKTVYGFGSDFDSREARFLTSADGGRSWRRLRAPEALLSLAIAPDQSDVLVASGSRALYRSTNGGRTWSKTPGSPGLLAWTRAALVLVDAQGAVLRRSPAAGKWERVGDAGGAPSAFEGAEEGTLYVALHDGTVKRSADGGRTWTVRSTP
jgi:photosystem II stability/assembly factor-like uncharacterized protein